MPSGGMLDEEFTYNDPQAGNITCTIIDHVTSSRNGEYFVLREKLSRRERNVTVDEMDHIMARIISDV